MKAKITGILLALGLGQGAFAAPSREYFVKVSAGLELRVGEYGSRESAVADIVYLPGFADRLDNHDPLFAEWVAAGFRVISFDYPSHGETRGALNNLDLYNFDALGRMALAVESASRVTAQRPLLLAGWSTGGLLALRTVQSGLWSARSPRALQALLLFAPGVAVRTLVGEHGFVTNETLTRNPNPPHAGAIKPLSPLWHPIFSADLLLNQSRAQHARINPALPLLVITGDDRDDAYVRSAAVRAWVQKQRVAGATITAFSCPGAYHELDNEPGALGPAVRSLAADFARATLSPGKSFGAASGVCAPY